LRRHHFGGAGTEHCDFGQQPIAPVLALLQATVPFWQHLLLRQPVPVGQHTFTAPAAFPGHTDSPFPHFFAGLQVLAALSAQPQSQQLPPQGSPTRHKGSHSLPLTQPAWQQTPPQI
jgi:hypothetical protein